jgi:hypothetical protein
MGVKRVSVQGSEVQGSRVQGWGFGYLKFIENLNPER